MITVALWVKLTAKKGQEQPLADFLKSALPLVAEEPGTINWYAIRLNESTFAIFDTFPGNQERQAHLSGKVAAALMENAPHLLESAPSIEMVDILASK